MKFEALDGKYKHTYIVDVTENYITLRVRDWCGRVVSNEIYKRTDATVFGLLVTGDPGIAGMPLAIERAIFNDPATVVIWNDGTKTVVKCQDGDEYDPEKGLALCCMKKMFGNKGKFNDVMRELVPEPEPEPNSFIELLNRYVQAHKEG